MNIRSPHSACAPKKMHQIIDTCLITTQESYSSVMYFVSTETNFHGAEIFLDSQERIANLRRTLPELPDITRERLRTVYGLSSRDLDVLFWIDSEKDVPFDGEHDENANTAIAYFDRVCAGERIDGTMNAKRDPKVVVNW